MRSSISGPFREISSSAETFLDLHESALALGDPQGLRSRRAAGGPGATQARHRAQALAAYYRPENNVSLDFMERPYNKMRVIQWRAYELRDQEYLRLKILTCMPPPL